jgi:hypothetical protein
MVKMMDLLSEYCRFRNFLFERLDGRIRDAELQKAIDRFECEEGSFLFTLSTRAGGVGINLVSASNYRAATILLMESGLIYRPQTSVLFLTASSGTLSSSYWHYF